MAFCLPQQFATKFINALKDGTIQPEKLIEMTSEERRTFFKDIVGETDAREVNALLESKLLLQDQKRGMVTWAKQVAGISEPVRRDIISRIERMDTILNPKDEQRFLEDLAAKKLGTDVSFEEAKQITELSKNLTEARAKMNPDFSWKTKEDGLNFGTEKVALQNYVNELKLTNKEKGITNPVKHPVGFVKESVTFIAENSRAIVASVDNSLWFRQGMRAFLDPRYSKIWLQDFAKSWSDMYKVLKGGNKVGDAVLDGVKAEIYSRKNSLNGRYEMGKKLDIGTGEEAYPTSAPSKIPILGRFFRAAEVAYEAGAMRLRADIADKVYAVEERAGVDLKDKTIVGDLNEVINSITGRGRTGLSEGKNKVLNQAFFSIKFFKSNLDYLTLHQGRLSTPATKLAATNLLNTVAATGVILGITQALDPEGNKDIFNPISSNFGKIRLGKHMTIDTTHGAGGIVVLAAKIITQKSKSGVTGKTTKLGEHYGSQTGMDLLWNFTENKFSPLFSVMKEIIAQKTFEGNKPTTLGELQNLAVPISIQNINQFKNEDAGIQLIGLIADGLGLNTNVYQPRKK